MPRLRYLTAGESHGSMLTGILEGIPAGLELIAERDIDPMLRERQKGYGRGRRQQIEEDRAQIISGVRFGITTGAPIALLIENRDWANWSERMSVTPIEAEQKPISVPRPGHVDLAGGIKYGHEADLRNAFDRASARETAMRVALGAIAKKLLFALSIESVEYTQSIGPIQASSPSADVFSLREQIAASAVRCYDEEASAKMRALIDQAKAEGDTLGGVVMAHFRGMPIGVGSHVQWDRKLDAAVAQAMLSIQAVKGVEIGSGFFAAASMGSEAHDAFRVDDQRLSRTSNHAGGIEGGTTNGEDIVVRVAMKPISTLMRPLDSVDLTTGLPAKAHIERSDVCAVPSIAIIVNAVASLVLVDALLDAFGGDTMDELRERVEARRKRSKLSNLRNA